MKFFVKKLGEKESIKYLKVYKEKKQMSEMSQCNAFNEFSTRVGFSLSRKFKSVSMEVSETYDKHFDNFLPKMLIKILIWLICSQRKLDSIRI